MNGFVAWLMSPLSEWYVESLAHKLFVGVVGAGVAWYLHSKKLPTWQIVLYALGAAYATSMVLNASRRFVALPGSTAMPMLPAATQILPQQGAGYPTQTLEPTQAASAPVADEKKDLSGEDGGIFG